MPRTFFQSLLRILKFALSRGLSLFFAIVVATWLTITVASHSGVLESEISGAKIGGWFSGILHLSTQAPREGYVPYQGTLPETIDVIIHGLTLNLGDTNIVYLFNRGSGKLVSVSGLILDFLSRTLLLFGTANLLIFLVSISAALLLYRHYGSFFDRLVVTLSPLSSVPAWIYGLALVVIAARVFHFYPVGIFDQWPEHLTWSWLVYLAKSIFLPILAIFISKIFQGMYAWRTFFLVYATEDYVEMAKAKGLSNKFIDRRYVMRPALPSLLTSFATMITGIWQEAIILELFFGIAGIGHLFYNAMRFPQVEMPLLIGLTVTFAYLLAGTSFLLDIVYVLVDPRVHFEGQRMSARPGQKFNLRDWLHRKKPGADDLDLDDPAVDDPFSVLSPQTVLHDRREPGRTGKTGLWQSWKHAFAAVLSVLREFRRYPSAIFGLAIVFLMVAVSIFTLIAYPYQTTIAQWRNLGISWNDNPMEAAPAWTNWFRIRKLAETKILNTEDGSASKVIGETENGMTPVRIEFPFDYNYDAFPTELILRLKTVIVTKKIFISPTWIMPDGQEINAGNFSTLAQNAEYSLLQNKEIVLGKEIDQTRKTSWFSVKGSDPPVPLKGRYILRLDAFLFEPGADINAQVLLHGQLYGIAGTDRFRRDLLIPLLWGTPIALTFGLMGALLATLTTMTLAAIGTWFGGWVDGLIQRLTEINMVLPAFPLLVLVYITVSKNVWIILGLAVLLNLMNNAIKNYRATFIQIKESGYIEAAQAYGASSWRIIFHYLIPRILPVMIPQLVSLAPGLVFLEATLAYLNISDPTLPTWGKLIQESISNGALNGTYYQVMEPVTLLIITGLALSMIGFALDRILNPKLREI
jgi:peptide/nickel transport system permease protein